MQVEVRSAPIFTIQALRAVAALMVVFHHVSAELADWSGIKSLHGVDIGAAGVDIFFVISGFIMVYSSSAFFGRPGASRQFMVRRLIRIVPLYWLISGVLLVRPLLRRDLESADLNVLTILASFFFVPWPRPSGDLAPLLRVGWTLNYEFFFYIVFALCIFLTRRRAIAATTGLLLVFVAIGPFFTAPPLVFLSSSIVLEFAFGMAIGLLHAEGLRLSRAWSAGTFIAGISLIAAAAWIGDFILPRIFQWGGPAALLVAACALSKTENSASRVAQIFNTLGDASYAIYLLHPFMSIPRILLQRSSSNFAPWETMPIAYAGFLIFISMVLAIGAHFFLERPLTAYLRRLIPPRDMVVPAAKRAT